MAPSVPSKSATPASRRRGAAMTASATATASATVRAPLRPPSWPSSMSTSSGRSPGTSAIAASRIATFASESAYRNSSRRLVAGQPRPQPADRRRIRQLVRQDHARDALLPEQLHLPRQRRRQPPDVVLALHLDELRREGRLRVRRQAHLVGGAPVAHRRRIGPHRIHRQRRDRGRGVAAGDVPAEAGDVVERPGAAERQALESGSVDASARCPC